MPRKASGNFDQAKYMAEWRRENMRTINGIYKAEFVDEFKTACKKLNVSQSEVFRQAMEETIKKASLL